jgi:hypothetical protein
MEVAELKVYPCPNKECKGGRVRFHPIEYEGLGEPLVWYCRMCEKFFTEVDRFGVYPLSLRPWDIMGVVYRWDNREEIARAFARPRFPHTRGGGPFAQSETDGAY